MTELLIVFGTIALSLALRTSRSRFVRKAGAVGFLAATYLAFWFATRSVAAGVGGVALWFLVPWLELLTRVRRLRLPVEMRLEDARPPNRERFPNLGELTGEVEAEGFEHIGDKSWEWAGTTQFHRIFHNAEDRQQAVITLTEQYGASWASMTVTSRNPLGLVYHTTNLPFSSPMKLVPGVVVRQVPEAEHFDDLVEEHRERMAELALEPQDLLETPPEEIPAQMELETGRQIRHNLEIGIIRLAEGTGAFCYSWRGLFFLYFRVVRDMVKLC